MIRTLIASLCLFAVSGCSTLGISLYPTGHFLTKQAEAVLDRSPSQADLPTELEMSVVPTHYLQPGDVLLIEPNEFSDNVRLPADQVVLSDGTIDLGGFGRLQVAGMTLEDAEVSVERRLVDMHADPAQVNVRLMESVERFYVLGEVQSPGSYPLVGHETVLDGILKAGGLTDRAAPCKLLLARPTTRCSSRITLPICYRQITQLGDTSTNYQLQPGDRIFVASRTCCEELMFWQASETCQRCCPSQSPCCYPEAFPYTNPVSTMIPPAPVVPNWSQDPERTEPTPLRRYDELMEADVVSEPVPAGLSSPSDEPITAGDADTLTDPAGDVGPDDQAGPDGELDFDRPLPNWNTEPSNSLFPVP
tara:strand:+ start:86556 stop:87644 length:1089 start_codon:yes stop_codon:yes gene_type:complete